MEFAVLEIGLRNKQMSNVCAFLRIQVEAFKVDWADFCVSAGSKKLPLFSDWEQVFLKILSIINATLLPASSYTSANDQKFGLKLSQIAFQTIYTLIDVLRKNPFKKDHLFQDEVTRFINMLTEFDHTIKSLLLTPPELQKTPNLSKTTKEYEKITEQMIIESILEGKLPLIQYNSFKTSQLRWKDILNTVINHVYYCLKNSKFEMARQVIEMIGLPLEKVIDILISSSFDQEIKKLITQNIFEFKSLSEKEPVVFEIMTLINKIYRKKDLHLSLKSVNLIYSKRLSLLIPGVFMSDPFICCRCQHYSEANEIWAFLIQTNGSYHLKWWIETMLGSNESQQTFPSSLEINQQMIDYINENTQDYLSEQILCLLASYGLFVSPEMEHVELILRRLFWCSKRDFQNLLIDYEQHPLKSIRSKIDYSTFQTNLLNYMIANELYQIVFWYANQNANLPSNKMKNLLSAVVSWNKDILNDSFCFNAILEVSGYLLGLNFCNLQILLETKMFKTAIIALHFAPKRIIQCLSEKGKYSVLRTLLLTTLCENYGVIYQAFTQALFPKVNDNSNKNIMLCHSKNEMPSIYTLLNQSTKLNLSRLFCWQKNNLFRNPDNTFFREAPHISHPKLAGHFGLKVTFDFIYYLKKGRAFEAYNKLKSKSKDSYEPLALACKKAGILAFYNCNNWKLCSACIIFHEILNHDSNGIRLHLQISDIILSYASKYLDIRNQTNEIGNILKRAYYMQEKAAIIRLKELLIMALAEKCQRELLDECIEYRLVVDLCLHYKLELPTDFLEKCTNSQDWLIFTIFAQIYDYPKDTVCKMLTYFDRCIAEHLERAFSSNLVNKDGTNLHSKLESKINDSKVDVHFMFGQNQTISKLPVFNKQTSEDDNDGQSEVSVISFSTLPEIDDLENSLITCGNLMDLIIKCQRSANPWRALLSSSIALKNPVLALIVASQKGANIMECFKYCLIASIDTPSISTLDKDCTAIIHDALSVNSSNFVIIENILKLFTSSNNPLCELLTFFIEFLIVKDYQSSGKKLKSFQKSLWTFKDGLDLENKRWIEETSVAILSSGLKATESPYELHILLQYLNFSMIQKSFTTDVFVPDFNKMYSLSKCLLDTNINLNISKLLELRSDQEDHMKYVVEMVSVLQEGRYFAKAQSFASYFDIDREKVLIDEWKMRLTADFSFPILKECFNTLEVELKVESLRDLIKNLIYLSPLLYTAFLLAKDFSLAYKAGTPTNILYEIESNLWMTIIKIEMTENLTLDSIWNEIWSVILDSCDVDIEIKNFNKDGLTNEELIYLDLLIGKMLNDGRNELANRVCSIFNHKSHDLEIMNLCNLLVHGRFDLRSSKNQAILNELNIYADINDTFDILEKCLTNIKYAEKSCSRIVLYYKISFVIDSRYSIIKCKTEEQLLKELLKLSTIKPECLNLARELILFASINDDQISTVILEEMMGNPVYNVSEWGLEVGNSNFLSLIRLMNNPSVLGRKFMDEMNDKNAVEMCIKAHECFNLSCDIQGIALVLRSIRSLVMTNLVPNKDYHSMVRLLNGIGRYSEMSYIIDILKEANEFQLLLSKGNQRSHQLRVALLDSLKGHTPFNEEKQHLIAFNFGMHREIAEIMDSEAKKTLKSSSILKPKGNLKQNLDMVLEQLIYASDTFKKAGCYHRSDQCEKLAELVALQIMYLPKGISVINLSESMASEFIANHPIFLEALIVSKAYSDQRQWNLAIFNNVVLRGNFVYLRDYSSHFQLNCNNFEEIINLFNKHKQNKLSSIELSTCRANLQKVILTSKDIKLQYKYSQELGFIEISSDLTESKNGVYLKDLRRQGMI